MALAVVDPTTSLEAVLEKSSYILGELPSHPLAAPYSAKLDSFQNDWFVVHRARTLLMVGIAKARGAVNGADDRIDDFVDLFDRTLLIITKNDRSAALYSLYFGLKAPYELKRPILSDELTTVRAWIPSIQSSPLPSVSALAPTLTGLVAAADTAVGSLLAATQALKEFDAIGPKKPLIDGFNATCKTIYGELAVLPHKHPEAMLPTDFADRFFPHESHKGLTSLTNLGDVEAQIGALKKELEAAEKHRDNLQAKAKAKADKKKAEQAAAALVAEARQGEKEARQKKKDAEKALQEAKKNGGKTPRAGEPQGPAEKS